MELSEKARNARAEYYKQWRKENPDKVKATQERYWLRKAEKMAKANEQQSKGV